MGLFRNPGSRENDIAMTPVKNLLILTLIACLPAAAQDPNVTIYAPGPPGFSTFDPANPPPELRPPEAAFCRFIAAGSMPHPPQFTFDGSIMTLTGTYPVSFSMSTTIFLPTNATDVISEHRNGHSAPLRLRIQSGCRE